jgi:hypothetical protein
MGWRAWDACKREAHERWKHLPWFERNGVFVVAAVACLPILLGLLYIATPPLFGS